MSKPSTTIFRERMSSTGPRRDPQVNLITEENFSLKKNKETIQTEEGVFYSGKESLLTSVGSKDPSRVLVQHKD